MIKKIILFIALLSGYSLCGQVPIDVAESTLKVGLMAEEIFYFGFAEGDQLIFNFEEANGKELKELEIVELPATSKFMDYKTSKVVNKIIKIPKTGIYKFRFTNSSIGVRVCKYKIQRIPASPATQNFNTTVYTHVVNDTTYASEEEDYLAKNDTVLVHFQDRTVKVNVKSNPLGNKAMFNFVLPENVIGWSYYIMVNGLGQKEYEAANKGTTPNSKFNNYTILSALAMNIPVSIDKLQEGEDIDYWIMEGENANLFNTGAQFRYIKKGKAINDYARMEPRKGNLYFCFSNDNSTEPVTVTVKVTTVQVNETLESRPIKKMLLTPKSKMYLKN